MYIYYTYIIYKLLYVYNHMRRQTKRKGEGERESRKIVSVWWKIERLCL